MLISRRNEDETVSFPLTFYALWEEGSNFKDFLINLQIHKMK